jgi:hypothetical protein
LRGSVVTDLEAGYKCVIFSIKKYRIRWSAN